MTFKEQKNLFRRLMLTAFFAVSSLVLFAQNTGIGGLVTSADDGQPLIGVTVIVKGTTNGTTTDVDGKYFIKSTTENPVLVFSMVGMKKTEVAVKNKTTVNLVMESDAKMLEQVVVTGYTSQKKADLIGAISVVNVNEMMKQGENNPIKALQGRIPGVNVSTNGNPSGASTVRIRGIGTLNNNDPVSG